MTIAEIRKTAEQKMHKTVEALKHDLTKIRTGRAHPGLLDHIHVEYYGSMAPLSQVAQVGLGDARTITVQPWEKKMVAVVEKAIRDSDLGVNPASHGDVIRVPMPPLTEERRRDLVKVVHNRVEEARVAARNVRRDSIKDLREFEQAKMISEDERKNGEDELQKLTDRLIDEINHVGDQKEKEILEV